MPIQPRPEILNTPAAYHGAFDYAELERLGLSPDEVIDFSVNSNPYGPPPGVRDALAAVPLERYPDRECIALRRKLAERHEIAPENVVVGNGTAELLLLLALAFINAGDTVLVIEPDFSEYKRVAALRGGRTITYRATAANQFQPDYGAISHTMQTENPRVVFWCSPNNPTGVTVDAQRVRKLVDPFPDTLFVFDEAYFTFHHQREHVTSLLAHVRRCPNALVLRSMTKDYGLAGLRLGYAVGAPSLIAAVAALRPAWNVNALAQAAGVFVLDQAVWLQDTLTQLHRDKSVLVGALRALGLTVLPSDVNYFLVHVGDAAAFRAKLLAHNIMVRDCASFGLPAYVRIATRTPDENAKLVAAVKHTLETETVGGAAPSTS